MAAGCGPLSGREGPRSQGVVSNPPVQIMWPKFKARRLSQCPTAISGLGPKRSAYELMENLGHGNFGTVWTSRLGGHELAVKVFKEAKIATNWPRAWEASIAERLDHPNVVRLLDCVKDGTKCLLVYERAGCSLASCLLKEFPGSHQPPTTGFVAKVRMGGRNLHC